MDEPTQAERELVAQFSKDMAALIRAVPQAHRDSARKAFGNVFGMLLALRRKIDRLEAKPELKYFGVWQSDVDYREASVVTRAGSMWVAAAQSKGVRPGDGACWTLAVKHGKDMRA